MNAPISRRAWKTATAARLLAATMLATAFAPPASAQQATTEQPATVLDTLTIRLESLWTRLAGKAKADTGTVVYGTDAVTTRVGAGGDANSVLRNTPNVQYQNDSSNDAGSDSQDLIDTKPMLLSISGGKSWENNFKLNGIGINTITGTEEPFGSDGLGSELEGYEQTPNINKIYGLHPQTIFVPAEFVQEATVIDSNASARHGEFLGGVVDYTLTAPSSEKGRGSVSFGFTADELTTYNLGTRSGTNPQELPKPEYGKYTSSMQYNLPINESWSVLGQYSRTGASSSKIKDERYNNEEANDRSRNEMFRLASRHDTDYGIFTLDGTFTNYSQKWDGFYYNDTVIDAKTKSLATRLQWERDLELTVERLGLKNVKMNSNLYFNDSKTINSSGSNETWYHVLVARTSTSVTEPRDWFYTTDPDVLAMCSIPTTAIAGSWGTAQWCRDGGFGTKRQGQEETGFKSDIDGDFLAGTFAAGLEYRYTDAYREAEQYTFHSVSRTLLNRPAGFVCDSGDEACTAEQYASTKTVTPAYNNRAYLNHIGAYAELDQTWDWLNVRAGLRLDYEDFFNNLNIAPRIVATVTPIEDVSVSAGFNRYYAADTLSYAVRDGQPLARASSRTHNAETGEVGDWTELGTQRYYAFKGANVSTPYKDEYTAALVAKEPWFDGQFRLRFLERRGYDEFMSDSGSSSVDVLLTNGGESRYRSASLEYEKRWDVRHGYLDTLALTASVTWSKQKTSTVSPFYDEDQDWYWWNGQSYNPAEFDKAKGNLDIPVRTALDLSSRWFDGRLSAVMTANLNMGFTGVRFRDETCTPSTTSSTCPLPDGSDGIGKLHNIYDDYDYDPTVTVDLKTRYRVSQTQDTAFDLELSVFNVFNETGNRIAQDSNPWIVGRTVWFGAKASF